MKNKNRNIKIKKKMGNACKKLGAGGGPTTDCAVRTSSEIREIIKEKLNPKHIRLADGKYGCYSIDDLKKLLESNEIDEIKYIKQKFDCDDFATALLGREKKWWHSQDVPDVGSSFGMVHGDIRKSEDDTESRPHAVNFLVDHEGEVWLIEPQNDKITKPTSNSTFWFTFC